MAALTVDDCRRIAPVQTVTRASYARFVEASKNAKAPSEALKASVTGSRKR